MEKTLFYNIVPYTYAADAKVEVPKFCNGITVVNIGNSNMVVNGVPLAPPVAPALLGEAFTFGGNRDEIFYGRIDVSFTGAVGRCIVLAKEYIEFHNNVKPYELK